MPDALDTSQGQPTNYLDVVVALDGGQAVGLDDAPVTVSFVRVVGEGRAGRPVRALWRWPRAATRSSG